MSYSATNSLGYNLADISIFSIDTMPNIRLRSTTTTGLEKS